MTNSTKAEQRETTREPKHVAPEECPDCERPSPFGERCPDCRDAFDHDVEALNADLRDI